MRAAGPGASRALALLAALLLAACGATAAGVAPEPGARPVRLQILALNDFHGALSPRSVQGRPAGGAAVLAAYLGERAAAAEAEGGTTLLVHAGDMIGGSPLDSALLQDEPTVRVLDAMGMAFGAAGNHEFDEGAEELLRLQHGGCHPATEPLTGCFEGARFRWLAANVVRAEGGEPLLPPYAVVEVQGVPVGFIGVVLEETPTIAARRGVAGLRFLDEVEAVNRYAAELKRRGVRAVVVLIHQGGYGRPDGSAPISGPIADLVPRFDPEVDVVVSGHTHQGYVGRIAGRLVTQAYASGTAFADIDLVLDAAGRDVVASRAELVTTFHRRDPGDPASAVPPDPAVAALVARADALVAPIAARVVGTAAADLTRVQSRAGESALGNLIADAQRAATGAQIALTNPGGIRDDIRAGEVTYADLFAVQPFGNGLVTMTLTGEQIHRVLERQWQPGPGGSQRVRFLQVSGLRYVWDDARPVGRKVVRLELADGTPVGRARRYTVTVNDFLAEGGDAFTPFRAGADRRGGPLDLDALVEHVRRLPQPFGAAVEGRITRRD